MQTNFVKGSSLTYRLPVLSTRERVEAVRYEDSLSDFVKAAWHHAWEPQNFQSNWHIDCVSDHLMAVARREIHGPGPLIFTMPPRHMKSRGANVFFPAWTWAQNPTYPVASPSAVAGVVPPRRGSSSRWPRA
jgi:hypothetical protein